VTAYEWAWAVWALMFVVVEGLALHDRRRGGTLSEAVWFVFSIKAKGRAWQFRRFVLVAFLAWLSMHFLTGMWV